MLCRTVLLQSAELFLSSCDAFRHFFDALSTLDVLAGFAAATHPSAAPPGCTFCRPTFAAVAANRASNTSSSASAPPMKLRGVWSPALLASCSDNPVQANDVQLGGSQEADGHAGMLLLTGANAGGKSTLLRATCLAAIMAQVSTGRGCLFLSCIPSSGNATWLLPPVPSGQLEGALPDTHYMYHSSEG
jgi:DNA mismatch repair protein MSH6